MYRPGHIQTEDLPEESLHFFAAQSGIMTLAVKYPKTLRLSQFKVYFNIGLLKEMMSISTLRNYFKEFNFLTSPPLVSLAIGKVCNGLEGLLY